jgi:signal peptidase II
VNLAPAARATAPMSLWWGAVAFALDRGHKFYQVDVVGWRGGEVVQVTSFFDYVLVWNTGVSYGLLGGVPILVLGAIIAVALAALLIWWWRATQPLVQIGLMLCIGGAASNALDRVLYGAVADFFHFHWGNWSFYIFNLADTFITFGVLLLLLDLIGIGRRPAADPA